MKQLSQIIRSAIAKRGNRTRAPFERDVRGAFKKFQKILESNARALRIVADLGEKMSGSYLFDITFIQRAYSDLAASVKASLTDFSQMTGGKYPQLDQVFAEIDTHISGLISGDYRPTGNPVIFFNEIKPENIREVGGKNFHLAELGNLPGLKIPEGFALTVFAFEEFVRFNHLSSQIEALKAGRTEPKRLHDLRRLVLEGSFPPPVRDAVALALKRLRRRLGSDCYLAVRSSAEEEDNVFSFAGQFETILNVPAETGAVEDAYRRVLASLFSEEAVAYQSSLRYTPGTLRMAVGLVAMVDAEAAGVAYTADPRGEKAEVMIISSAWGLGKTVVEGGTDADYFLLEKQPPFKAVETRVGNKQIMSSAIRGGGGGVADQETPAELRGQSSISPATRRTIAERSLAIEKFYRRPQDIEWAVDKKGEVIFLQARPLKIGKPQKKQAHTVTQGPADAHRVLFSNRGYVVQRGAVAGKVFQAGSPDGLDDFPLGAILVARNDSPAFARVMPYAAAIITDSGNPTGHMASISRELRVPTVVNTETATSLLKPGEEITLVADDDGQVTVYEGLVRRAIDEQHRSFLELEELYEFRRKKYIMQFIAPLNLINPLADQFRPENCKTLHDILRFIHEMSIQELIEAAKNARGAALKHLDLPIPLRIQVIDVGGGLVENVPDTFKPDNVVSVPFKEILRGMTYPNIWQTEAGSVRLSDFLAGMVRAGDLANTARDPLFSVAVVSKQYMNLSLRLGYHFNLVDSYLSERAASNHIYFRFFGGGAALTKRLRRVELIETVLKRLGFVCRIKGDLIEARISNISQAEGAHILDQLGRLIAFTRQLDAALGSDHVIDDYANRFMKQQYVM